MPFFNRTVIHVFRTYGQTLQIPNSISPPAKEGLNPYTYSWFCEVVLGIPKLYIQMGVGFVFCGLASYILKDAKSWIVRCVPVAFFVPIWTYSGPYDRVVMWPWLLVVLLCLSTDVGGTNMISSGRGNYPKIYLLTRIVMVVMIVSTILQGIQCLCSNAGVYIFNVMPITQTINIAKHISNMVAFALFCFLCAKSIKSDRIDAWRWEL